MNQRILAGAVLSAVALAASAGYVWSAPAQDRIPQLTPAPDTAWQVNFWDYQLDPPPGSAHGPIKTDPAHPYNSQIQNGGLFRDGELQVAIVNAKDPVLKPWAAKEMQESNEELLSGKKKLSFRAQSRCWPGGVPGQLLFLEPVYFLQTQKEVVMLWQRNSLARHILLTEHHSPNVKPSWSGESIGHYENGDTLVVDTIGIKGGKYHFIDNFRTPHSDKLHVVERFTVAPDGKSLTAIVTVEDPETFNAPLTLTQVWRRTNAEIEESVCAEDGGVDRFQQGLDPIPVAAKPDF
ncbi:MAG TPA: hypothetical protein VHT51_09255 [Micropepsaceae bacterium]|nr:hypothetical protein [Micropepsaceae bacterium]